MSRDALVVGINVYEDEQLTNLQAPAIDAEAIAKILTEDGDFRVKRIPEIVKNGSLEVGKKTQVSLTQLEEALVQLFVPKGKNIPETALFYFSGHGIRKERGIAEGFLVTSDVYPQLGFYGLSLQWLRRLLEESTVRQQIIWLDCCYSGELLNFAEADPGDRGKGRDRNFIAASREFEVAYENITGNHSVLTGALLQGLDPKRQENRIVTNYDLIDFLNQSLKTATQRPLFANSGGQIILTGRGVEFVNPILGGICPYKGLAYFDCNDSDPNYFYGRNALTDQLLEKVRLGNFLAVLGASGSGKSSVVRAGLLHQLKLGQRLSGSEEWPIYIFRPGEHPLQRLAEVFIAPGLSEIDRATQLAKAEELITAGCLGLKQLIAATNKTRVILVVDQLEEVFTLCQDNSERQEFFDCLLSTIKSQNRTQPDKSFSQKPSEKTVTPSATKLCLILTMRADFFSKCTEYGELAIEIQKHLVTVTPMTSEELEQAITEPAKKVGLEVERELVNLMIADVESSPSSLPLLQYTLTELWQQRIVDRLTLAAYTRLGGVKGTLQKRANEIYESLLPEEQETAQQIFLELTQLGEGTEDTRRQVFQRDLIKNEESEILVAGVIQKLADAKLIVTSTLIEKGLGSEPIAVVDIAHEALIRSWPLLRQWLNENRNALRQKRNIEADAKEWLDKGKAGDYLLKGLKLAEGQDFLQRNSEQMPLSSLAQEFVAASQADCDRRRRYTIIGLIAALIVTTGFSILASWEISKLNGQLQADQTRKTLINKINKSSVIEGTQEFSIKKVAVNKNSVWMAVYQNDRGQGLWRYDIQDKSIKKYLEGDRITAILPEEEKIWVGVEGNGLLSANLQDSKIKFTPIKNIKDKIMSLAKDGKGNLWIDTDEGEIYRQKCKERMELEKVQFTCGNTTEYQLHSADQIALTTKPNIVWIATSYGLLRWQLVDGREEVKCYYKKDEPPNGSEFPLSDLTAVAFNPKNSFLAVGNSLGQVFILKQNAMTLADEDDRWNPYPDFTNGNQVRRLIMLRERFLIAVIPESYISIYDYLDDWPRRVNLKQDKIKTIHDAFLARDNILWIGTDRGLYYSLLN